MGCIHADGGSPNYTCGHCEAENTREWLSKLVVGSPVGIRTGYGTGEVQPSKVIKLTPTQIVVTWGSTELRFRRETGGELGRGRGRASWGSAPKSLVELTTTIANQIKEAARRRLFLSAIESVKWRDVSTKDLEQVLYILDIVDLNK